MTKTVWVKSKIIKKLSIIHNNLLDYACKHKR